jgi:hypothetical protein
VLAAKLVLGGQHAFYLLLFAQRVANCSLMDWQRVALSLSRNGKQLRFCISLSGC